MRESTSRIYFKRVEISANEINGHSLFNISRRVIGILSLLKSDSVLKKVNYKIFHISWMPLNNESNTD